MLNGKQIREVTAEGITYIDDDNVEQFINFAECYENNVKKRLSPETWEWHKKHNHQTNDDWTHYVERIKGDKVVGGRNFDPPSGKPFIEFYTQPPIVFDFQTRDEFDSVNYLIRKARYRTQDLA